MSTTIDTLTWQGPRTRGSGWLEWQLDADLAAPPAVYDPDTVDLACTFYGPGGRTLRVTGFWREGAWWLRLLPPVPGAWHASPQVNLTGGGWQAVGRAFSFRVAQVPTHQHIGVDSQDPRFFAFEDGTPFVPVGLNIGWSTSEDVLADYRRWFSRLAAAGGNFARLWMASWSFGIEWSDTGLGDYRARETRAAQLDAVFELAEAHGIRLMLCLLNHGAFTEKNDAEWHANPYNSQHGGPLTEPQQFVSNEQAIVLFERRVRYIAARWAMSPALHSWEWWNEVTWTPIANEALRPWIERLDLTLAAHDPYRRLRSTSWADRGDAQAWALPALDYAQQHDYTQRDPRVHYAEASAAWAADGMTAKPLVPGELGRHIAHDDAKPQPFCWDAVQLHNGLWAPLFAGFASTALYWWWDKVVDPQNLWPAYRGVASWLDALHDLGLGLRHHRPHPAVAEGGSAVASALAGPNSVLLWVRAERLHATTLEHEWQTQTGGADPTRAWQPVFEPQHEVRVKLRGLHLPNGLLNVRWLDATTGQALGDTAALVRGGTLECTCPAFERDVAAIAVRR